MVGLIEISKSTFDMNWNKILHDHILELITLYDKKVNDINLFISIIINKDFKEVFLFNTNFNKISNKNYSINENNIIGYYYDIYNIPCIYDPNSPGIQLVYKI